jgi:hypothetical protein
MARQVVDDDDVAGAERPDEDRLALVRIHRSPRTSKKDDPCPANRMSRLVTGSWTACDNARATGLGCAFLSSFHEWASVGAAKTLTPNNAFGADTGLRRKDRRRA